MSATPSRFPDADPQPPESAPGDVGYVLDALKLGVEQELEISQRLRDRGRQTFVLAIAFFTVVQTVAFNSFDQGEILHHKAALISVLALAIAAIVLLFFSGLAASRADAPGSASDLDVSRLQQRLEATYEGDLNAPAGLGQDYLAIMKSRREANKNRLRYVGRAELFGVLSIAITTVELIVSLALRIP